MKKEISFFDILIIFNYQKTQKDIIEMADYCREKLLALDEIVSNSNTIVL